MSEYDSVQFSELKGKTLTKIEINDDKTQIIYHTLCGEKYRQQHNQDCCESVGIEDICGDLADVINSPIVLAEESTSQENPKVKEYCSDNSFTWTFYKLSTIKGPVTVRWYGESNGYYSEGVNLAKWDKVEGYYV